jgi:hypothetical protein
VLNKEKPAPRVNKIQGLAAFSPDALASIGYADQEIFLGLVVAGSLANSLNSERCEVSSYHTLSVVTKM